MISLLTLYGENLEISGEFKFDRRFYYEDSIFKADYPYDELTLKFESGNGEIHFFASTKLRVWDMNLSKNLFELTQGSSNFPYEFHLWEAYAEIYEFLRENIDLSIGKRRIAWGTADRLNQTDNLNPLDFSDPLDFGKRVPIPSLEMDYTIPYDWSISLIWLPSFKPSILPKGEFPLLEKLSIPELNIVNIRDSLIQPKGNIGESYAFKLSGRLSLWDFSLSYFKGHDYLPLPKFIQIRPIDTLSNYEIYEELSFPEHEILGFDFAGEFKKIGLWGEFAYIIPKKFVMEREMPFPTASDTVLLEEPYLKFTLGGDYTMRDGIYLNFQWMHGFFVERGRDNLHDYIVGRMEKNFFKDKLKMGINGLYEIADPENLKDHYGYAVVPELTYKPHDNVEITVGIFSMEGKGDALLSSWRKMDQAYLKLKVSF